MTLSVRTVLDIWPSHPHPIIRVGYIHAYVLKVLDQQLGSKHVEVQRFVDASRSPARGRSKEEAGGGGRTGCSLRHERTDVQPPDKTLKGLGVVLGHGDLALNGLLEATVEGRLEEV